MDLDDLHEAVNLRQLGGVTPDICYRCPTTQSMNVALRNECETNAAQLIPTSIISVYLFATASNITIPVTHQANLAALIEPQNFPQAISVEAALCHDIHGKDRLKIQRAVAKSIVEVLQDADGFQYAERHAHGNESSDGTRFKFVCRDSVQNRDRRARGKKNADASNDPLEEKKSSAKPTYDCGGAVHMKFSTKRQTITLVYKHNPIHSNQKTEDSNASPPHPSENLAMVPIAPNVAGESSKRKRPSTKSKSIADEDVENARTKKPKVIRLAKSTTKAKAKSTTKSATKPATNAKAKATQKKTTDEKVTASPKRIRKPTAKATKVKPKKH